MVGLLAFSSSAMAFTMVGEVNTQATTSSCQSYAFAVLLTLEEESFGSTAKRLHETEMQIRNLVVKHGGTSGAHTAWDKAIIEYTKGKYKLVRKYLATYADWVSLVRERTTPSLTDLMNLTFQKAVATSVSSIDNSSYESGHVITIVGIDDSFFNNKITYLNGGIKPKSDTGFSDHMCRENGYGNESYAVGIRHSNNYRLKRNGVFWIESTGN